VGDFVKENLVDVVIGGAQAEVARHGNPSVFVVTLTKTCFGVIEMKTPRRIQVKSNERIRPDFDPV
jgi:hypothetical protein